jgi:transmembrane sensor
MSTHDSGPPDMGSWADHWARRMADNNDPITGAEREQFNEWLLASDKNERDFRDALIVLEMVNDLPVAGQNALISPANDTMDERDRVAGRRNIFKFAGIAAAAALALVTGGWYLENRGFFGETHTTHTGETRTVKFSEGSVAYLNTRTEVRWLGSDDNRRVELVNGEALFDVVHDENRPFSVVLENSEIRVLGTRFNVYRKDGGDVVVTVLEGTVEVRGYGQGAGQPEWVRRVKANQQIQYRSIGLVSEPHETDPLVAVKWRSGVLQMPEGATLPEVLDELTRYTDKRILIRDPRLATVKLGGVFSTRNVRSALQRLQTVAPIEVHESEDLYTLDFRPDADPAVTERPAERK